MRGKNTLYNEIIPSSLPEKGQRNSFQEQRDDKLAYRFYYYAHLCRLRYDDCLLNLSKEFDISPNRIIQLLTNRTNLIKKLVAENKQPADLKKAYGFYNWSINKN